MEQDEKELYFFMNYTRGDWRNSVYIECKNKICESGCMGFLMTADTDGTPVLYPASRLEERSGEIIDKSECAAVITREVFESVYNRWLIWNVADKNQCSLLQAMNNRHVTL